MAPKAMLSPSARMVVSAPLVGKMAAEPSEIAADIVTSEASARDLLFILLSPGHCELPLFDF